MKKYSTGILFGFIITIGFTIGLISENKFSILNKGKEFIRSLPINKANNPVLIADLNILLSDSAMIKLKKERKNALNENKDFSFFNAGIINELDTIPVKLRLKGDRSIHFKDQSKWSFRVKTIGDNTIFNIKRFSLHRAGARNYIYEWLFHEALNSIDLIGLDYKFIRLKVNNEDLGIYAFEEHFENSLLINRGLTLGPILRFNEDYSLEDLESTYVDPFQSKYWLKNNPKLLQQAISNLEMWRRGELKTSEVFNTLKIAKYFAITDVLWVHHAQAWKSIRFYFNPDNQLIEPIGYDGHYNDFFIKNKLSPEISATLPLINYDKKLWVDLYKEWYQFLFVNPDTFDEHFIANYVKYLKLYSNKNWLDDFFLKNKNKITEQLSIIDTDPFAMKDEIFKYGNEKFKYSSKEFYSRSKYIRSTFRKKDFIHAYPLNSKNKKLTIEIENIGFYAVKIDSIFIKNHDSFRINEILIPHSSNFSPNFKIFELPIKNDLIKNKTDIKIHYHIIGENTIRVAKVFKWKRKATKS